MFSFMVTSKKQHCHFQINEKRVMSIISAVFILCLLIRLLDYFILRMDQSRIGENFIHKIAGILLLALVLAGMNKGASFVGFVRKNIGRGMLAGLFLSLSCFVAAYCVEYLIEIRSGSAPGLALYVAGFSLSGEAVRSGGLSALLACAAFNLINVTMEEGVFRGLFINLAQRRYSFLISNLIAASFFGIWHVVMPLRSFIDHEAGLSQTVITSIVYILMSALLGIKWGLLYKRSGALWIGFTDHFTNNFLSNTVHINSINGSDTYMVLRIVIAQLLSLAIVIVFYKSKPAGNPQ